MPIHIWKAESEQEEYIHEQNDNNDNDNKFRIFKKGGPVWTAWTLISSEDLPSRRVFENRFSKKKKKKKKKTLNISLPQIL